MTNFDIYGIGNALVDIEVNLTEKELTNTSLDKGVMTLIDEKTLHELVNSYTPNIVKKACGGSAANTIIGASHMGANCYYSCKVANDKQGIFYIQDLTKNRVSTNSNINNLETGITGNCFVCVTPDGDRTMATFLGITSTFSKSDINFSVIDQSKYLYIEGYLVTSPSGKEAAVNSKQYAQNNGVPTALSLSDPSVVSYFKNDFNDIIGSHIDILFCNEDEALTFSGSKTIDDAILYLKKFCNHFIITQGAKGSLLFYQNKLTPFSAYATNVVDTNGAGDLFAGIYLGSIAKGMEPSLAIEMANFGSSILVSKFGPRLETEDYQNIQNKFNSVLNV
ncbi:adenosine kinase [Candidatus Marinamargulisbacteria bacterium SCGC AG-410-N11]|nr:adenosine kinase [Candidatus Marinamargulisbacteria bacterium SCGC AG-410-N11]